MFRHYCVILRELVNSTLLIYTSMSVQSLVIQFEISHMVYDVEISAFKLHDSCATWQGTNYKLPEDDTIVSKHVGTE